MPTGYTAAIADNISFKDYALGCAKAFGACITLRDEPSGTPIPDEFPVADYHYTWAKEAQEELEAFSSLTAEEVEQKYEEYFKKSVDNYEATKVKYAELEAKYLAMLSHVLMYKSPSPEHDNFKAFMESQIRESITHDCDMKYYDIPKRVDYVDWWTEHLDNLKERASNRQKRLEEEIERVSKRNLWIKLLKESLNEPKSA